LTNRVLSEETIKKLLKKADEKLPSVRPIFTEDEHRLIRKSIKDDRVAFLSMRGRWFTIKRFRFHNEDWVTIRPKIGFVPMFSGPVKWALDVEKEI